jgi:hypothetical protein
MSYYVLKVRILASTLYVNALVIYVYDLLYYIYLSSIPTDINK